MRKRDAYHAAKVNVVEIDLLRAGQAIIDVLWKDLQAQQIAMYGIAIRRAESDHVGYVPLSLRAPLSAIRIPLRENDSPVLLDLQQTIDLACNRGGFAGRINYDRPLQPPLSPDDAAWARGHLAANGRV